MKKNRVGTRGLLLSAAFAGLICPVVAEAGNGLYFGLEGGANFVSNQNLTIYDYHPLIGGLNDGSRLATIGLKTGYLGGVTFGYGFEAGPRLELEVTHRYNSFDSIKLSDNTLSNTVGGKEYTDTGLANVWFDFFKKGSIHPYLGGGIGASRVAIRNPAVDRTGPFFSGQTLRSDFDTVLAFQGGAGINFDLGSHWAASVDYRYLRTNKGKFDLLENSPNSHVETIYESHSGLVSIHYYFSGPPAPAPLAEVPPEPVAVVPVEQPAPPAEPEVVAAPAPAPGCKPPAAGQAMNLDGCAAGDVLVLRGVNFQTDKSTLTLNAKKLLDDVITELKRRTDVSFEIDGHTDSQGSDAYNQRLSERRAASVMAYLASHGIAAKRMSAHGFGESMPIADNETADGREMNRRVALKVTAIAAP